MTEDDFTTRKPQRLRHLLLVLAVVAIVWATATLVRSMLPPPPLELARAAIDRGQFDVAIQQYQRHLAKYPDDWGAHGELGLVLSEVDRPRAVETFRKVPADAEAYLDAQHQIASLCLATQRLDEAEETLLELTERTPNDWWPQLTLAELYFSQARPREALACAQRAAELNSEQARAHFLIAEILDDLQRPAEMIAPLQKLIDLDLENYAAHINLSYAYAESGQPERSQEEAQWCLARNANVRREHRLPRRERLDNRETVPFVF